jgi:glycosyltransferase involved in cell wall biosynthesis
MLAVLDQLKANDRRFEFVAIAPQSGRLAEALSVRGIPIRDWSPYDSSGQRLPMSDIESLLKRIVESLQPALLHANSLAMGRLTGRLASGLEIPTTSHLRDIVKLTAGAITDLNGNRKLIAVSNATRDFHVAQGINASRLTVIHNGIDLELFQPRNPTGYLHTELCLPTDDGLIDESGIESERLIRLQSPQLIATIGQIGLRKGQNILAAAAPLIVAKVPQAHFLLIGERTSQKQESIEFEKSIARQFADSGLSSHLHMLGHRDDIPSIFNEVDLLIHPANQEPFGRVLLEASASGTPIVATNVGGTAEIVLDGTTGLLVPPRNPESLASAAIELLTNEKKASGVRFASRERAISEFPIFRAAERLGNLWSEFLC